MAESPRFLLAREDLLHLPSMPRPLRVITGLGIAQVAAGILFVLLKDADLPAVAVGQLEGAVLTINLPILAVAMLVLISAWSYFLTGALHVRWWAGFACLALATLILWRTITAAGGWGLAPGAAAALWAYFVGRRLWRRPAPLLVDFLVVGTLVALIHLAGPIVSLASAQQLWRSSLEIGFQATALLFMLIPILVVAGVDLAELADDAGNSLANLALRATPAGLVAAAAAVVAALKVVQHVTDGSFFQAGSGLAVVLLALLALASYSFRRDATSAAEPPFWLLLLLSYALFALLLTGAGALQLGSLSPTEAGAAANSLADVWTVVALAALALAAPPTVIRAMNRRASSTGMFVLIWALWILATVGAPTAISPPGDPPSGSSRPLITFAQLDLGVAAGALTLLGWLALRRRLDGRVVGFAAAALLAVTLVGGMDQLYELESSPGDLLLLVQVLLLLAIPAAGLLALARGQGSGRSTRLWAWAGLAAVALAALGVALVALGQLVGLVP
ncbi:MAG: hypothetical protein HYY05_03000, partial [Chloroflexi bacterium]|nr:hypothetical protein [Chloroflexota bacterium]